MKQFFTIGFMLVSAVCFSQSANVQSAANSLKLNQLEKAKNYIDEAAQTESTSNDPKMWYYRGKVYMALVKDSILRDSDLDAPEKSAISFINCLKTDKKNYYTDSASMFVWLSGRTLFNKGVEAYNKGDLHRAERFYKLIYDVIPLDKDNNLKRNNITADIVTKNLYFVAYKQRDNEKAKMYLQKLVDANYNDPMIYVFMSRILLEQKDTAKALTYIDLGKGLFEDNLALENAEMNIYLNQGKLDVLITKLSERIEKDSENEVLYYKRGLLYENIKNEEKAVIDYRKAIELKNDYFDPNYSLGLIYFDQAARMANEANSLKSSTEFDAAKKRYELKFKEAQLYLEQAVDLNSNLTERDKEFLKATLSRLKKLYAITGQTEKYEKAKVSLEKL